MELQAPGRLRSQVRDGVGGLEGGTPCGEHRESLFTEGFEEGGVGCRDRFEHPIRALRSSVNASALPKSTAADSHDPSAHNATPAQ